MAKKVFNLLEKKQKSIKEPKEKAPKGKMKVSIDNVDRLTLNVKKVFINVAVKDEKGNIRKDINGKVMTEKVPTDTMQLKIYDNNLRNTFKNNFAKLLLEDGQLFLAVIPVEDMQTVVEAKGKEFVQTGVRNIKVKGGTNEPKEVTILRYDKVFAGKAVDGKSVTLIKFSNNKHMEILEKAFSLEEIQKLFKKGCFEYKAQESVLKELIYKTKNSIKVIGKNGKEKIAKETKTLQVLAFPLVKSSNKIVEKLEVSDNEVLA